MWEPEVNEDRCLIVSSEPDRTTAPVNSLTSGVVCKRPADIKPANVSMWMEEGCRKPHCQLMSSWQLMAAKKGRVSFL